jgi:NAD-dependent deacetylase
MSGTPEGDDVRAAGELLRAAQKAVFLTGAGFSTPSGIPDFRSEGAGLWTRYLPMEVASLSTFRVQPHKFFAWLRPLASHMWTALPNPAHLALARLEEAGTVKAVITQNIDGLHARAGSKTVYEIHGTLNSLTCTGCFQQVSASGYLDEFVDKGELPYCPHCGRLLKPDVILFEEQLPVKVWQKAEQAARSCDLMVVCGTSLEVMPSAGLPVRALDNGAKLVIVNQTTTYVDVRASVLIRGNVADIIPLIEKEVLHG